MNEPPLTYRETIVEMLRAVDADDQQALSKAFKRMIELHAEAVKRIRDR